MHCFLVDENLFLPKHFCILGSVLSHNMFKYNSFVCFVSTKSPRKDFIVVMETF